MDAMHEKYDVPEINGGYIVNGCKWNHVAHGRNVEYVVNGRKMSC